MEEIILYWSHFLPFSNVPLVLTNQNMLFITDISLFKQFIVILFFFFWC